MATSLKQHLDAHLSMGDQKARRKTVGELRQLHLSLGEAAGWGGEHLFLPYVPVSTKRTKYASFRKILKYLLLSQWQNLSSHSSTCVVLLFQMSHAMWRHTLAGMTMEMTHKVTGNNLFIHMIFCKGTQRLESQMKLSDVVTDWQEINYNKWCIGW